MNKAMLCSLKTKQEEKKVLIVREKVDIEAYDLEVDQQIKDNDPEVQELIKSPVGKKMNLDFFEGEKKWQLKNKKMFISDFDYAYDISSLDNFINSLIRFKINDKEIDIEIIEMLKNDIFTAADFWENENIDEDLTAELILKYWNLDPVNSYPDNEYYKILLKFADQKIEIIDEKIAKIWFDIPDSLKSKINEQIESEKIEFKNYLSYLKTRENNILNDILFNFINKAAEKANQEILNNLFEKFHYQLTDELTKKSLEKDQKIDLNPVIPHAANKRDDLELKPELKMKDFSLLEIFNHYKIEIDFSSLNLFTKDHFDSLTAYIEELGSHIDYLNQMRDKLKCSSCNQMMEYELDYLQEIATYKVVSASCNNTDCENYKQQINF